MLQSVIVQDFYICFSLDFVVVIIEEALTDSRKYKQNFWNKEWI